MLKQIQLSVCVSPLQNPVSFFLFCPITWQQDWAAKSRGKQEVSWCKISVHAEAVLADRTDFLQMKYWLPLCLWLPGYIICFIHSVIKCTLYASGFAVSCHISGDICRKITEFEQLSPGKKRHAQQFCRWVLRTVVKLGLLSDTY